MNKPVSITVPVDSTTLDAIDRAVAMLGEDRESFAADVLKRAVENESEFLVSLDEAERQIDRGECHTQEEIETWVASLKDSAAAS